MKFAKELEQDLVPEWRAKYLDYKVGKKKLKAVARAIKNVDRSPTLPKKKQPAPLSGAPFDRAPVYSWLNRTNEPTPRGGPQWEGYDVAGDRYHDHANPDAEATPRAAPRNINERSPLRPGQGQGDTPQGRGMTRYGSIIGSPPREPENPTAAQRLQQAPSFHLPDPALDPNRSRDTFSSVLEELERPVSPNSPDVAAKPQPRPADSNPNISALEVGKSQQSRPPTAPALLAPRYRSIFQPKRVNSLPSTGDSRPFARRLFSVGALPSPKPFQMNQNDIALEAYKEVDFRQADFFIFLDKQMEKIEDFYKSKEEEATKRLEVLRQQLHVMRDKRLEEIVTAENNAKTKQRSGVDMDHPENGPLLGNGNLDSTEVDRMDTRQSRRATSMQLLRSIGEPVKRSIAEPFDRAIDKVRPGHIGKTSEAMGQLGTPKTPRAMQERIDGVPDRRDYTRRPASKDVPYRTAKRKLKIALAEYYRGLELLKSYALLNRTAFRKINKKFDKTVNARPSGRYMSEKVNKAHFVNSELLDGHIQAVEDLYARYFERGSHKAAVGKLRAKIARAGDYTGSVFRNGLLCAAGAVFTIEGLTYGAELLSDPDPVIRLQTSYLLQLYAGYWTMLMLVGLFVIDCRAFTNAKVNYAFVFEFDTRHHLDWRQLAELPSLCFFLLGLVMWLTFSRFGGETMYIYWPVILIGITGLILFNPIPFLYHRSRFWFLYSNWRLAWAGVYPVEFRDFFLGDMYCSQTYAMGNIELFFCLYAQHWSDPPMCNSSHSRLLGFFSTLPGIWRLLQCLRRYYDTRNWFPHLLNGGKYTFTILSYLTISLFRINKTTELKALFIVFCTLNSVYCSIWDVIMDWSLGDPYAKHPFLRQTLAYKQVWWYYLAMVLDPILRFNWIFYAIYADDIQHSSLVSFFVAFSEVCRRGMWTLFRVENEHCTNVGRFRASRDIPLPYEIDSPSTSDLASKTSTEHQRTPPTPRGQVPPNVLNHQTTRSTATDIEHASPHPSAGSSLRQRKRSFPASSPVVRGFARVGTVMHAAHAQDFERKRRPDLGADVAEESDEDDERSSESEDEGQALRRKTTGAKKDERDLERLETGEERSRAEISGAGEALERAGTHRE